MTEKGSFNRGNLDDVSHRADLVRQLADLEAASEFDGENLTYQELANALGVSTRGDNINTVDLVNACLSVGSNPAIRRLPTAERVRVISSAAGALEELLANKGQGLK